jgi:hypothetical protein
LIIYDEDHLCRMRRCYHLQLCMRIAEGLHFNQAMSLHHICMAQTRWIQSHRLLLFGREVKQSPCDGWAVRLTEESEFNSESNASASRSFPSWPLIEINDRARSRGITTESRDRANSRK